MIRRPRSDLRAQFRQALRDQRGASAVHYLLGAGAVGVLAVGAFQRFRPADPLDPLETVTLSESVRAEHGGHAGGSSSGGNECLGGLCIDAGTGSGAARPVTVPGTVVATGDPGCNTCAAVNGQKTANDAHAKARLQHVQLHSPAWKGGDGTDWTNRAWAQVQQGTIPPVLQPGGRRAFTVPMGQAVGYQGGASRAGAASPGKEYDCVQLVADPNDDIVASSPIACP